MASLLVRRFANSLLCRDIQARSTGHLPSSVKIIVGVAVAVAVTVLLIVLWRVLVWRRSKAHRSNVASCALHSTSSVAIEKGNTSRFSLDSLEKIEFRVPDEISEKESVESWRATKSTTRRSPSPPPLPALQTTLRPPPPTKRKNNNLSSSTRSTGSSDIVLASPARSVSFQASSAKLLKPPTTSKGTNKKLPRLMLVVATYFPALNDELPIKVGETLRLIAEYEDQWCLVQRVGRLDEEKGFIPQFCLGERPDIFARTRKHSPAALFQTATYRI